MASKKIGVLGGSGYVGKYLCENLDGNIVSVTRKEVDLLDARATFDYLSNQQFDVVIGSAKHPEYPLADRTDIASTNLNIFTNVYAARTMYGRFINLGSGAEFDRRSNISIVSEDSLTKSFPVDGYGLSRNTISRICRSEKEFYTIRIFGVLHYTEQPYKLFRKLRNDPTAMYIKDSIFDYISMSDLCVLTQHYCDVDYPKYRDINAVYAEHATLYAQTQRFKNIHGLKTHIHIDGPALDYSGCGEKLKDLNLKLTGLDQGMRDYR
jgi:nucleoside-diphosphate-sugar epimerase